MVCPQAIWENQFYYLFGFLFLVFIILVVSCSQISIVMVYFQLCAEVRAMGPGLEGGGSWVQHRMCQLGCLGFPCGLPLLVMRSGESMPLPLSEPPFIQLAPSLVALAGSYLTSVCDKDSSRI